MTFGDIIDRERREEREETTKQVTQNTRIEVILEFLSTLGPVSSDIKDKLFEIKDPDKLRKLIPEAAHAKSIEEFKNALFGTLA